MSVLFETQLLQRDLDRVTRVDPQVRNGKEQRRTLASVGLARSHRRSPIKWVIIAKPFVTEAKTEESREELMPP
jgi:hypothetical protein